MFVRVTSLLIPVLGCQRPEDPRGSLGELQASGRLGPNNKTKQNRTPKVDLCLPYAQIPCEHSHVCSLIHKNSKNKQTTTTPQSCHTVVCSTNSRQWEVFPDQVLTSQVPSPTSRPASLTRTCPAVCTSLGA